MLGKTLKQMYRDAIDPTYSSVEAGIAQMTGVEEFRLHDANLSKEKLQSIFDRASSNHLWQSAGNHLLVNAVAAGAGGAYQGWNFMIAVATIFACYGVTSLAYSGAKNYFLRKEVEREIQNANHVHLDGAHPIPH
jgi:hypothetical protein